MGTYRATRIQKAFADLTEEFTRDEIGVIVGASRTWVSDIINGKGNRYGSISEKHVERAEQASANKPGASQKIKNYSDAWRDWFLSTAKSHPEIVSMAGIGNDTLVRLTVGRIGDSMRSPIWIGTMIALSRWMPSSSPQLCSFGLFDIEGKRLFSAMDCTGLDGLDRTLHAEAIWGSDEAGQASPIAHSELDSQSKPSLCVSRHRPLNGVRLDAAQADAWRAEVNRMFEAGALSHDDYRNAMTSIAVAHIGVDWTPFG